MADYFGENATYLRVMSALTNLYRERQDVDNTCIILRLIEWGRYDRHHDMTFQNLDIADKILTMILLVSEDVVEHRTDKDLLESIDAVIYMHATDYVE